MKLLLTAVLCILIWPTSANALSIRMGAGGGAGSGAVQIGEGDGDAVYTFRNKISTAWLQLGSTHGSILASDFGFFASKQVLTSDYTETSRSPSGSSGNEIITVTGGGLLYSLNILLGGRSEVAWYSAIGLGGFTATIDQTGDTVEHQAYKSGMGGCFDFGFIFGTGEAWTKSHLELFMGGQSFYTSLISGSSEDGRSLSDIYVGTLSWLAALSIKI